MEIFQRQLLGNSAQQWLVAIGIALAVLLALPIVRRIIQRRLQAFAERTESDLDDLIVDLVRSTRYFLPLILAIYAGSRALELPDQAATLVGDVTLVLFLIQAGIWGSNVISFFLTRYMKERMEEDAAAATSIGAMRFVGKLVLWSVVLLLALDNVGIDITALVTGLGVGGIAVALAVQNILGDLFASLSIVLDKPFVIGDFIIVEDLLGNVEQIGLKTTRLRSLSGEQLVFANSDLLNSRIRNYKRMFERRIVFRIGVTYETPADQLERIPSMIREIIESLDDTRFDRSHFSTYGDFALVFETAYYVLQPDYNLYMDRQQSINLQIFRRFEAEGIEFAYPTQTLYLRQEAASAAAPRPTDA